MSNFFGAKSIVHKAFVSSEQTVNEYYIKVSERLRKTVFRIWKSYAATWVLPANQLCAYVSS